MSRQKYETLDQTFTLENGRIIKRIFALHDFGNVKKNEIGGFIECKDNLSHDGDCWIADNAMAVGWSRVSGDAQLHDRARIEGFARVSDQTLIRDDARLDDYVCVYGNAEVGLFSYLKGGVTVRDHASVYCQSRYSCSGKTRIPNLFEQVTIADNAQLRGSISVGGTNLICGNALIRDNVRIRENAYVGGHAVVENKAYLFGNSRVNGHAVVGGRSALSGNVVVTNNAVVRGKSMLICNVYIGGHVQVLNEHLSGDLIRLR
jgi:UDP-3-O-[3-hydroxymyristoyl] glucosamine N-acyltransferase